MPACMDELTLLMDRDIEASLTVDESGDPVTQVVGDPIHPAQRAGPFLLIVRTGRIVTAHASQPYEGPVT